MRVAKDYLATLHTIKLLSKWAPDDDYMRTCPPFAPLANVPRDRPQPEPVGIDADRKMRRALRRSSIRLIAGAKDPPKLIEFG